jgi:hypothetical protein
MFLIKENPYTKPLTFYLMPFRVADGYTMQPDHDNTWSAEIYESWELITREQLEKVVEENKDCPNPYNFAIWNAKQQDERNKVFFFALGGNNCRQAWHNTYAISPNYWKHIMPTFTGHMFCDLTCAQAQTVRNSHVLNNFVLTLDSNLLRIHAAWQRVQRSAGVWHAPNQLEHDAVVPALR